LAEPKIALARVAKTIEDVLVLPAAPVGEAADYKRRPKQAGNGHFPSALKALDM
jgi:hypothetical protein